MKQSKQKWLAGAIAAGLLGSVALPVQAQEAFDNRGIEFSEDTIVEFEFVETQGANRSALGIVNLETRERVVLFEEEKPYDNYVPGQSLARSPVPGDFRGTVSGGTVRQRVTEFTFEADTPYAFFLESYSPITGRQLETVLSTSNLAAQFRGDLDGGQMGQITGSRIIWDDDGLPGERKDSDFDDFVIEAGGYLVDFTCPPLS
jgi:hypothetical protein